MCELVTAGTMSTIFGAGAPALTVMNVAGTIGAAMGAVSAIQQGQQASAQAKAQAQQYAHASQVSDYNAAVARNSAIAAEQQAQFQADQSRSLAAEAEAATRRKLAKSLGTSRLGYAKGGVAVDDGSPLDVLAGSAMSAEYDIMGLRRQGETEAQAALYGGQLTSQKLQAEAMGDSLLARSLANRSVMESSMAPRYETAGYIGGASRLLSAGGAWADKWGSTKKTYTPDDAERLGGYAPNPDRPWG